MRILVVGAGATGGFFGARLVRAGRDVTFLVRPRRAALLRERGLRITGLGENEILRPELVTAAELAEPYDVVLVSVKAAALERAVEDVAPAVGPRTVIVPFLNGMAHLDTLNARFGKESVLGGVVKVMTTINADGDILRVGPLAGFVLGEQGGGISPRVAELGKELDVDGYEFTVSADIIGEMWRKWAFIASLGAITCLMRGSVGDVAAVPGGAEFARAVIAEAAAVASAAGHPVPDAELEASTAICTRAGSPVTSSMYRDVAAGNPAEVEHVFGDLVARARAMSVDTPLLDLATLHLRVHQHRVTS
ncbi:2-dehydropantoate 2-reductase [Amycolatopsis taiwanensis]|uniref:2-dehydropantoate 2-reductase n=1 Tax=Amycolatopsis taiwanensis TaxID=342230 RepID=A0A9W6R4S9_9PSEU|nr:2-dehydropantoate 2-reductase [Amycolatopsis taiwanensis]GLY69469.1 2-dehydropantoate 2-reductase [Amycolatopsis taiwanensis]